MSEDVYEFMSRPTVVWCCSTCVPNVLESFKVPPKDEVSTIRQDLDSTINVVKNLMDDFYRFMNGPIKKSNEPVTKETSVWKTEPKQDKSLKDILLEANAEQKREEMEQERRQRNIIIHRSKEKEGTKQERDDHDAQLVTRIMEKIKVKASFTTTRLGKKDAQTGVDRPILVSFQNIDQVASFMSNLNHLKDAEPELKNLRVSPDRSLKERENVRQLLQEAKNRTATEKEDYVHIVRNNKIIRVKKRSAGQTLETIGGSNELALKLKVVRNESSNSGSTM